MVFLDGAFSANTTSTCRSTFEHGELADAARFGDGAAVVVDANS
jgi:hypothetical protein